MGSGLMLKLMLGCRTEQKQAKSRKKLLVGHESANAENEVNILDINEKIPAEHRPNERQAEGNWTPWHLPI